MAHCADFTDAEPSTYLLLLKEAGALPEYVKEIPEPKDLKGLPTAAFAASDTRKFPIYDKTATFLSAVQAFVNGMTEDEFPFLGQVRKAAAVLRIEDDIVAAHKILAKSNPEVSKCASHSDAADKFALHLVVVSGDSPKGFYPIANAVEVRESAEKMAADMEEGKLPIAWFAEGASALMKAAAQFEVDPVSIPAQVKNLGEPRLPDRSTLDYSIEKRASLVPAEALAIYREAAELALRGDISATDGALVFQVADRKFGIHQKFAGLRDPIRDFWSGVTEQEYEQLRKSQVLLGEVVIPKAALDAVDRLKVASLLSQADARAALQAQDAENGIEATKLLNGLSPSGVVMLSSILSEDL